MSKLFPFFQLHEEDKILAPYLTSDEALPDPHPPMDAAILSEDLLSTDSSSTKSEIEFV